TNISALQVCLPRELQNLKGLPFVSVERSRTANRGRFELDSNQPSEVRGIHGIVNNGEALSALALRSFSKLRPTLRAPWPRITMDDADAYAVTAQTRSTKTRAKMKIPKVVTTTAVEHMDLIGMVLGNTRCGCSSDKTLKMEPSETRSGPSCGVLLYWTRRRKSL
ncbi:hypothetical protein K443DRAFT_658852, partial [Laccaria amethystina LaAM-08-1]